MVVFLTCVIAVSADPFIFIPSIIIGLLAKTHTVRIMLLFAYAFFLSGLIQQNAIDTLAYFLGCCLIAYLCVGIKAALSSKAQPEAKGKSSGQANS